MEFIIFDFLQFLGLEKSKEKRMSSRLKVEFVFTRQEIKNVKTFYLFSTPANISFSLGMNVRVCVRYSIYLFRQET